MLRALLDGGGGFWLAFGGCGGLCGYLRVGIGDLRWYFVFRGWGG